MMSPPRGASATLKPRPGPDVPELAPRVARGVHQAFGRFVTSPLAAGAVPVAGTTLAQGVIQMMWLARPKPQVAVAAALILATAGVAVQGRQQPAPEGPREQAKTAPPPAVGAGGVAVPDLAANRALAREELTLIDKALELLRMGRTERSHFAVPSISLWRLRKVEALHRAGAGKAEIVAALEKYVNSLKEEEAITEELRQSDRGNRLAVYDARFRRMEAEIWLNEERAR